MHFFARVENFYHTLWVYTHLKTWHWLFSYTCPPVHHFSAHRSVSTHLFFLFYLQHCCNGARMDGSSWEWRPNLKKQKTGSKTFNDEKLTWHLRKKSSVTRDGSKFWYSRPSIIKVQKKSVVAKLLKRLIVMSVHVAFRWKTIKYHLRFMTLLKIFFKKLLMQL